MFITDSKGNLGTGEFSSFATKCPFFFLFCTCFSSYPSEEKGGCFIYLFMPE